MAREAATASGPRSVPFRLIPSTRRVRQLVLIGPLRAFFLVDQMVFLRLFLAQLSLAYFVRPLPANLRTDRVTQTMLRRPQTNLVGLQRWDELEEIKQKQG